MLCYLPLGDTQLSHFENCYFILLHVNVLSACLPNLLMPAHASKSKYCFISNSLHNSQQLSKIEFVIGTGKRPKSILLPARYRKWRVECGRGGKVWILNPYFKPQFLCAQFSLNQSNKVKFPKAFKEIFALLRTCGH